MADNEASKVEMTLWKMDLDFPASLGGIFTNQSHCTLQLFTDVVIMTLQVWRTPRTKVIFSWLTFDITDLCLSSASFSHVLDDIFSPEVGAGGVVNMEATKMHRSLGEIPLIKSRSSPDLFYDSFLRLLYL